jgi:hypothetical protein
MDIEHLSNNVVVMYLATKNATTRKWKKWVPIWRHLP